MHLNHFKMNCIKCLNHFVFCTNCMCFLGDSMFQSSHTTLLHPCVSVCKTGISRSSLSGKSLNNSPWNKPWYNHNMFMPSNQSWQSVSRLYSRRRWCSCVYVQYCYIECVIFILIILFFTLPTCIEPWSRFWPPCTSNIQSTKA